MAQNVSSIIGDTTQTKNEIGYTSTRGMQGATMDVMILDSEFENWDIVDIYKSFIWTERYNGCGEFELHAPINDQTIAIINQITYEWSQLRETYFSLRDSDNLMVVETIDITTDAEEGPIVKITGRGIEIFLDRRIIFPAYGCEYVVGRITNCVTWVLALNATTSAENEKRAIPTLQWRTNPDERIQAMEITTPPKRGASLYQTIYDWCLELNIGFSVKLDDYNQFCFQLDIGEDRSYAQEELPYVIFSPKFENLRNSETIWSTSTEKTTAYVDGYENEDDYSYVHYYQCANDIYEGTYRKELYVDARDISRYADEDSETELDDPTYNNLLLQRGYQELQDNKLTKAFAGEVESGSSSFEYGVDYFVGDIVQIVNEYSMETTARITEVVRTMDEEGYKLYPTFEAIDVS